MYTVHNSLTPMYKITPEGFLYAVKINQSCISLFNSLYLSSCFSIWVNGFTNFSCNRSYDCYSTNCCSFLILQFNNIWRNTIFNVHFFLLCFHVLNFFIYCFFFDTHQALAHIHTFGLFFLKCLFMFKMRIRFTINVLWDQITFLMQLHNIKIVFRIAWAQSPNFLYCC